MYAGMSFKGPGGTRIYLGERVNTRQAAPKMGRGDKYGKGLLADGGQSARWWQHLGEQLAELPDPAPATIHACRNCAKLLWLTPTIASCPECRSRRIVDITTSDIAGRLCLQFEHDDFNQRNVWIREQMQREIGNEAKAEKKDTVRTAANARVRAVAANGQRPSFRDARGADRIVVKSARRTAREIRRDRRVHISR